MQAIEQKLVTIRIVWGALLMSQLVFLLVANMVPIQQAEPDPVLFPVFAACALSTLVMSFLVPQLAFRAALRRASIATKEVEDPDSLPGFGKTVRVAADPESALRKGLAAYSTRVILECAFGESISLFGFLLRFLGHSWLIAGPFFVVGIVLIAVRFPSMARLTQQIEQCVGFPLRPAMARKASPQ